MFLIQPKCLLFKPNVPKFGQMSLNSGKCILGSYIIPVNLSLGYTFIKSLVIIEISIIIMYKCTIYVKGIIVWTFLENMFIIFKVFISTDFSAINVTQFFTKDIDVNHTSMKEINREITDRFVNIKKEKCMFEQRHSSKFKTLIPLDNGMFV